MKRAHLLPPILGLLLLLGLLGSLRADEKAPPAQGFQPMEIAGQLVNVDARDRKRNLPCKLHRLEFHQGHTYTLDMLSTQFDTYLRLEDPSGLELAEDDDSGGNLNSRITFTAKTDGSFRISATTYDGRVGLYTLKVREVAPARSK
jgi:hypothetical protein